MGQPCFTRFGFVQNGGLPIIFFEIMPRHCIFGSTFQNNPTRLGILTSVSSMFEVAWIENATDLSIRVSFGGVACGQVTLKCADGSTYKHHTSSGILQGPPGGRVVELLCTDPCPVKQAPLRG